MELNQYNKKGLIQSESKHRFRYKMKWNTILFLLCFRNCIFGPSFHGFGNISSAGHRNRVYYDEKTGNFETIANFRGNIVKLGTVVPEQTKNLDPKLKKKRICETTDTDLVKIFDLIDENTIVSVYESSGFICIEYY